jgi:type VI secretion system protein ImpE
MPDVAKTDPKSLAEAAIRGGDPKGALAHLTAAVRAAPNQVGLRVFLAQLLCVLGQWERAHTQLNVAADLDPSTGPMRETVGYAIRSELVRAKVFAGQRTPMVIGEPLPWLAQLLESLQQQGEGQATLASSLARQAYEAAPPTAGSIDGKPFEWIADADSRIGPALEACVNGQYYWIPFQRIASIEFDPPADLRDFVWAPAQLTFHEGGGTVALVPVRYPGSVASEDPLIQLARKTEWLDAGDDRWFGLGQRVLATDAGDFPLLEVHRIEFAAPQPQTSPASTGG